MKKIDFIDFFFLFSFAFIADFLEVISSLFLAIFLQIITNPIGLGAVAAANVVSWLLGKIGIHVAWLEFAAKSPWLLLALPVFSFLFALLVDAGTTLYLFLKGVKGKKVLAQIGTVLLEKVPFLSSLPLRTFTILAIYLSEKSEERLTASLNQ